MARWYRKRKMTLSAYLSTVRVEESGDELGKRSNVSEFWPNKGTAKVQYPPPRVRG